MADETRIAFIGAGGMAQSHMGNLESVEGANIVAICDLAEDRVNEVAGKYNAAAYTDYRRMLDEVDADAVYVIVPPFAHEDAEVLAVRKGCAIFVEKPVVLHMDKGYEIAEEIEKAHAISCVGYQLRLLDSTQRARKYLSTKTIGMVSAHRWGGLPGVPWWRVMDQSGGQLHEQTTHQIDLMRYIGGEIAEVYAQYSLRCMGKVENLDIPDAQGILFKFIDGAIGMCVTSPMMTQGGGVNDLKFLIEDHILEWAPGGNKLSPDDCPEVTAEPVETPTIDACFVQAIQTGDTGPIPCSYRAGLQTAAVTIAANESARIGKPIEVPII